MSNLQQEQFETELLSDLAALGEDCAVDIGWANFGDGDEWKAFVSLKGTHFDLLIKENTRYAKGAPFSQTLIAGHSPYSIAKWWQIFSHVVKEDLLMSYHVSVFRKAQMEPTVPRHHFHHIGYGATYSMWRNGRVEQLVYGTISEAPDSHVVRARVYGCKWFKPQSFGIPPFNPNSVVADVRYELAMLNSTRLIKAAVGVARASEQWTIKP